MNTIVEKNENATAVVTCTADLESWKNAQDKAFQKVKSNLKLKGFRNGNAIPDGLAKTHINPVDVYNEAINIILPSMYEAALKEHNLIPFLQPLVDVTKVSDTEIEVKFEIALYPEVKLGEYKGLTVALNVEEVTDAEVEASLRKLALQHADLVVCEEEHKAKIGDTVVLDFKGFIGDKQFDGGSAENYSLELGSNQFVPGFEEQLVGVSVGQDIDVNVTFPTQYVKDLAGKDATFKCTIHEIKTKITPEITDEFAKELNIEGVETVEQLKDNQRGVLAGQKERSARSKQFGTLIDTIVASSTITMSDKVIDREVEAMKNEIKARVEQNGLTFEQYLEITNNTEEKLNEGFKAEAVKNLSAFLTLNKIAEVEDLRITDEDVDNELAEMAKQYNMTVEAIKSALGENLNRVRNDIHNKKIEKFLKDNNNL